MSKQKLLLPVLALALSEIFWGLNTVFIKMGLQSIPVTVFIAIRFLAASLILLPFAIKYWKPLKRKELYLITLASLFTLTLNALLVNIGLTKTTAINASVIIMLGPLLLFIMSASVLKEGLKLRTFIGISIALIGSLIIIGKPIQGNTNVIGDLLILMSVFCTVIGILIYKPLSKTINPYQMTFMGLFIGVIPISLFSITQLHTWNIQATSSTSVQGLIWSTVSIVIASFLFYYALRYKKAESIGVYQYLEPLATILAAWFLLGESLTYKFAIGAVLVFIGVYIVEFLRPFSNHKSDTVFKTK